MATLLTGSPIHPSVFLRKDKLPAPLRRRVRVFSLEGISRRDKPLEFNLVDDAGLEPATSCM